MYYLRNQLLTPLEILVTLNGPDFDVSTPHDRAVFYSGNNSFERSITGDPGRKGENWKIAQFVSEGSSWVSIGDTPGGKWLEAQNTKRFGKEIDEKLWGAASLEYARAASGNVLVYVEGALPNKVFRSIELPALLQNQKVSSINELDCGVFRLIAAAHPGQEGLDEIYKLILDPDRFHLLRANILERQNDGLIAPEDCLPREISSFPLPHSRRVLTRAA